MYVYRNCRRLEGPKARHRASAYESVSKDLIESLRAAIASDDFEHLKVWDSRHYLAVDSFSYVSSSRMRAAHARNMPPRYSSRAAAPVAGRAGTASSGAGNDVLFRLHRVFGG